MGWKAPGPSENLNEERGVPRVPIVAMTGQAMDGDREKCLETGMDDYIIKPINKMVLLEMIQKF